MLCCCEDFAVNRSFKFKPSKIPLLTFSCSPSSTCSTCIHSCGQPLPFLAPFHILATFITISVMLRISIPNSVIRKADCLLATFPRVGPFILTHLFQSYCCPLYGSGLWSLLCPALQNIEVGFSKVLRRIWILPAHSHTCIVHLELPIFTAYSTSFIIVRIPFRMLLHIPSLLVQTIFMIPLLLFLWIKHHV